MDTLATISISEARLPAAYEAAKQALANCESIDECQQWADKAEALASYAKQADDHSLRKQADRIQARAIRRCGELLKQFNSPGARTDQPDDGTVTRLTQKQAAKDAGISERQRVTAVRVANVAATDFEQAIESEAPATVTKLADMGRKPAPKPLIDLKGRDPQEFNRSLHFIGEIKYYAEALHEADLDIILPGLSADERERARRLIADIDNIHDRIMTRI